MVVFASLGVFAVLQTPFWLIRAAPSVLGVASAVDQAIFCCLCSGRGSGGRLARGEEIDVERHALLCSTLTRLAQRIGLDRRAKNITPSLREYLAMKDQEDAVEIVEAAE